MADTTKITDLAAQTAEAGISVDADALEARLTGALADADLSEAAAAADAPRDDSDLFDTMFAEDEADEDDLEV